MGSTVCENNDRGDVVRMSVHIRSGDVMTYDVVCGNVCPDISGSREKLVFEVPAEKVADVSHIVAGFRGGIGDLHILVRAVLNQ